jgi:hypothetical protein
LHSTCCHDILTPLDRLRGQRNKISHTWNARLVDDFFNDVSLLQLEGMDVALTASGIPDAKDSPEAAFRIRTIWLLTRLFYECLLYERAKRSGLKPYSALYGKNHPKFLGKVSYQAVTVSWKISPRQQK